MGEMRGYSSPNLDLTVRIIKNFIKKANESLLRGAVFQKQNLGQNIDIGVYMIDNEDVRSLERITGKTKAYPLTSVGEEYGIIRQTDTNQKVVSIKAARSAGNDFKGVTNWEEDLVESPQNMIDVKTIYDQILAAEKRIETYQETKDTVDVQELRRLEPPFYPRMSAMEMQTITTWQRALHALRQEMLKDKTYEFALIVAGMMGEGKFGIEKLLNNVQMDAGFTSTFSGIPSSMDQSSLIDSERDQLYQLKYEIEDAFNSQRMIDMRNQQIRLNAYKDPRTYQRNATSEKWISQVSDFVSETNATQLEIPDLNAPLATRENTPLSLESRRLEQAKSYIDDVIKGFAVQNSRERMLHALEWLQKVEILKRAEMTPKFKGGIASAMALVKVHCCRLRKVESFQAFAESNDDIVKAYFAELVMLKIGDFLGINPKRSYLDKRYRQIGDRVNRLVASMDKLFYLGDDGKVYSNTDTNKNAQDDVTLDPALYAF